MVCGFLYNATSRAFTLIPEAHINHHFGINAESADVFDGTKEKLQGVGVNTAAYCFPVYEIKGSCGHSVPYSE